MEANKIDNDALQNLAKHLKETRQKQNLSLEAISSTIKIRTRYLESIEKGSLDKLPNKIYYIPYLRCYADHLGVDLDAYITQPNQDEKLSCANENFSSTHKSSKLTLGLSLAALVALFVIFNL